MDKKKKKVKLSSIIILAIVIVILIMVIVFAVKKLTQNDGDNAEMENTTLENNTVSYVQEIEDGIKVNTSTAMNTSKTLDGLLISNIQLSNRSGMTSFLADVTNNTDTATSVKTVEITLLSNNGGEMTKLTGIINALAPGETTELNIATTSDYITAYDFTIAEK